jgi:hypothetical protein
MVLDIEGIRACLYDMEAKFHYRYAQWLIEDPVTRDYRVIAECIPADATGYAIAHRTGVIGQVFRTGHAIAVPDTRSHPLYDPFDTDVDWELAMPVWRGESQVAVLNIEGSGAFELGASQWQALCEIVSSMEWRIPGQLPNSLALGLVKTRRATFGTSGRVGDVLKTGARLAQRGKTVLVIGDVSDAVPANSLTACDAEARRAPLAECVRGVRTRMDVLPLGSRGRGMRAFERLGGWMLVEGRYEFVLVKQ